MGGRINRIILITIDSLRADHSESVLTYVSKILGNVVYRDIFANGPGTPQSFPSILASSSFLMLNQNFSLPNSVLLISQILNAYDYITVGLHSNPYLSKFFGWNRGFTIFHDYFSEVSAPLFSILQHGIFRKVLGLMSKNRRICENVLPRVRKLYQTILSLKAANPPYIDASRITTDAIHFLRRYHNRKLFLWIHFMDTHWPYNVPKDELVNSCGFQSAEQALRFLYRIPITFISSKEKVHISEHDIDRMKCLYRMSITYVSKNIEGLLKAMEDLDLLSDSLIIITSDHGEAFFEHGVLGHPFDALYDENLRVPLIIYSPCKSEATIYSQLVQHRELAPTTLELLGVKSPKIWLGTRSSFQKAIFAESAYINPLQMTIDRRRYIIAVINDGFKLILDTMGKLELYNLKSDPNETINVVHDYPDIVNDLRKIINRYLLMLKAIRISSILTNSIFKI